MFEINLLNKDGVQNSHVKVHASEKKIYNVEQSEQSPKNNKFNYLIGLISVGVVAFFIYVYVSNVEYYDENYNNVSIANILTIIKEKSNGLKIDKITTTNKELIFNLSTNDEKNIYENQSMFEKLLNTKVYAQINNIERKIIFKFRWHKYQNDIWNIDKLYKKIKSDNFNNFELEIYNNKLILISDYDDLIVFFNMLNSLDISENFNVSVTYLKEVSEIKKLYYKVIVENYD